MREFEEMKLADEPVESNELAKNIMDFIPAENSLFIKYSYFNIFPEMLDCAKQVINNDTFDTIEKHDIVLQGKPLNLLNKINDKFDYIVCDIALGMIRETWKNDNIEITARENWIILLEASLKLLDDGYALALIDPALWSKEWQKFLNVLNANSIFINAIFNMPKDYLYPIAKTRPILVLVSRKKMDKLYIAEIERGSDTSEVINNFFNNESSDNIGTGILVDEKNFKGFKQFHVNDQIAKLQTRYKDYESHTLQDISHEIRLGKTGVSFEEADNAIYIPKVGNSPVRSNLESTTLKHQNYFQILLNDSIVINEYAAQFYSSDIGRLIIDSLFTEGTIPNITKEALVQTVMAIPSLEEQHLIVTAKKKLDSLEESVESFKQELSLNPKSAEAVQQKVDDILLELNMLSECDQLLSLIRKGESKTLEFKETFVLNVRTKSRDEDIVKSSLKTIVAFLNTSGGTLLIGVHDNGSITGLNHEIDKFYKGINDKFLLFFKDKIKTKIGEDFYPFIDYKIVHCEGKSILKVIVEESIDPCYFNGEEFFVRTNPATDQLKGPKLVEYILRHFKRR